MDEFFDILIGANAEIEKKRARRLHDPRQLAKKGGGTGVVERTQNKFAVTALADYLEALKQFKKIKELKVGYFYSYQYNFAKNYNFKTLQFFDYSPLTFIYQVEKKDGNTYLWGINIHRLPLKVRQVLLNRLFVRYGINIVRVPDNKALDITWTQFQSIVRKIPFAIRKYRLDRVKNMKLVPLRYVKQIATFYPETLYSASMQELFEAYAQYKPK